MNTMTFETDLFDNVIKDYYEKEDYGKMKELIDGLIHDTFEGRYLHGLGYPMDLILKNIARFSDKQTFLTWVYKTYPHYEGYIKS